MLTQRYAHSVHRETGLLFHRLPPTSPPPRSIYILMPKPPAASCLPLPDGIGAQSFISTDTTWLFCSAESSALRPTDLLCFFSACLRGFSPPNPAPKSRGLQLSCWPPPAGRRKNTKKLHPPLTIITIHLLQEN